MTGYPPLSCSQTTTVLISHSFIAVPAHPSFSYRAFEFSCIPFVWASVSTQISKVWFPHELLIVCSFKPLMSDRSDQASFNQAIHSSAVSLAANIPLASFLIKPPSMAISIHCRSGSQNPPTLSKHTRALWSPCCRKVTISTSSSMVPKPPVRAINPEPGAPSLINSHINFLRAGRSSTRIMRPESDVAGRVDCGAVFFLESFSSLLGVVGRSFSRKLRGMIPWTLWGPLSLTRVLAISPMIPVVPAPYISSAPATCRLWARARAASRCACPLPGWEPQKTQMRRGFVWDSVIWLDIFQMLYVRWAILVGLVETEIWVCSQGFLVESGEWLYRKTEINPWDAWVVVVWYEDWVVAESLRPYIVGIPSPSDVRLRVLHCVTDTSVLADPLCDTGTSARIFKALCVRPLLPVVSPQGTVSCLRLSTMSIFPPLGPWSR